MLKQRTKPNIIEKINILLYCEKVYQLRHVKIYRLKRFMPN